MLSEKRISRLAAKYGPFVRFFPEGSEGNEGDALGDAIKEGDKDQLKDNPEFEKTRQRADQEAANAKKARDELATTQEGLETARSENESLKTKLAEAESKAAQAGITEINLDESEYQGTDLPIVKALKSIKNQLDASNKELDGLKKLASSYEEQDRRNQAEIARSSAYEELLSSLDEDYGADCRNEAVKMFQNLCDKGEVPKGNTAKATRALEKCYKEVKAAQSKDKKKTLTLDTGSGGGSAPGLSGFVIKEGQSLDEAAAQVAAASKTS